MIPLSAITEWRSHSPWLDDAQVEQDLLISRVLVDLFSSDKLKAQLAFRGGTALHKLHFPVPMRYSEDIDLVQIQAGPFGPISDEIRSVLRGLLGEPKRAQKEHNFTLTYRFSSEFLPVRELKLKIEVNTREHFNVYGLERRNFDIVSQWFKGQAELVTFKIEELLSTKLRALYQRRKGRDLFDLWLAVSSPSVSSEKIINGFKKYIEAENNVVSSRDFIRNLDEKMKRPDFIGDIKGLIRPTMAFDAQIAYAVVVEKLLKQL